MTFYQKSAATALKLITKFGRDLTLRRMNKTPNLVTGENGVVASEDQSVKCLVLPIASTPRATVSEADNKFVEALVSGKLRYLVIAAASAVMEPAVNDVSYFDGAWWQVIGNTPLNPAGTPLIYKVAVIRTSVTSEDAAAIDLLSLEEAAALFHLLIHESLPEAFPGV